MPSGPMDGWLWDRRAWHLCEIKRADKQGWKGEFTADQVRLMIKLRQRSIPLDVLRTEEDVLSIMNARKSA